MSGDKISLSVPKYTGNDFAVWKIQMEALLQSKGLHEVLVVKKTDVAQDVYDKKDMEAKSIILLALDAKYVKLVMTMGHTKDIWNRLQQVHEQKSACNRIALQKEFFDTNMSKNEKVAEYVGRVEYLASQLNDIGISIDESTVVGRIVSGLTKQYSSFVTSWMGTEVYRQTLSVLLPRLMAEEQMKSKFNPETSVALHSDAKPKHFGKGRKAHRHKPKRTPEELEKIREKSKCFICKQKGHWKKDCPQSNTSKSQDATAIIAEVNVVYEDSWLLDTGASEHMSYNRASFINYKKLNSPKMVRYGDGHQGEGIGVGDIEVVAQLGGNQTRKVLITNVLYVPMIKRKLISLSAVTEPKNFFLRKKLYI